MRACYSYWHVTPTDMLLLLTCYSYWHVTPTDMLLLLVWYSHILSPLTRQSFKFIISNREKKIVSKGLTFVITGVLESIDRDETKSIIERLGGKVTTNVSKNTKYLIVGRDAGAAKMAKVCYNIQLFIIIIFFVNTSNKTWIWTQMCKPCQHN